MRRAVALAVLLAAVVTCGCAYYNTFYGARKAWDQAMQERERNVLEGATATEIGYYDVCIRASTNLLMRYPDSKYVDEAVLLIGKCQLGKGDYEAAVNQFQLLCDSLPRSPLVPAALAGKGQALLKLRRFAEAETTLSDVLQRFPDYKSRDDVLLTLGDALRQQKRSRDALEAYTRLIREYPDSHNRYRAQTYRGEAYFQLEEWDSARAEFDRVAVDAPRDEDRYAAHLKVGEAMERGRHFDEAVAYYRQLQLDLRSQSKDLLLQRDPELQLRVAGCEAERGNVDKALDMYKEIKEANPSNRFGAAAAYQLGYLFETSREDFDKAREYYDNCRTMPRSEFTDLAAERNKGLAQAAEYRKKMAENKSHFDSGAETAFSLAELYCFDMKKYDRALAAYQDVERRFGFTRFGPKAAYASAWVLSRMKDSTAADSAFGRVAVRYATTTFGQAALDTVRAHHGERADSALALARQDTTNMPLPRPPEAIADSIAQAAFTDSVRRVTVADSLRRLAVSDSLQKDELKRRAAAKADSASRTFRMPLPPGSSAPAIQAAEPDMDPRDAADKAKNPAVHPPGLTPPSGPPPAGQQPGTRPPAPAPPDTTHPGPAPSDTTHAGPAPSGPPPAGKEPAGQSPPSAAPASPPAPPAPSQQAPPASGVMPTAPAAPDTASHPAPAPGAAPDTTGAVPGQR